MRKMVQILLVFLIFCGTAAPLTFKTRKTLGRIPQIGDLYDRTRDLILPDSLFDKPLSKDDVRIDRAAYMVFGPEPEGMTFGEMADKMSLSRNEKLSVALGITQPTGSSAFLTKVFGKPPDPTGKACLSLGTVHHHFNFWYKDISNFVSLETLEKTNATDVIVSVRYGFETCYNYRPKSTPKNARRFEDTESRVDVTVNSSIIERSPDLACHPSMPNVGPLTMSPEEVKQITSQIHSTSSTNFGEPIQFDSLPLSEVRELLNLNVTPAAVRYQELPGYLSNRIISTVENLHRVKHKMPEFWNQTLCQHSIIPNSKLSLIRSFLDLWSNNMTQGIEKMAEVVILYRNGSADVSTVTTAHDNLSRISSGFDRPSVERKMEQIFPFVKYYRRLSYVFSWADSKLITNSRIMNELMRGNKPFSVLKYKLDWILENPQDLEQLADFLSITQAEGNNRIRYPQKYLLDCDILPEYCVNVTKITVNKNFLGKNLVPKSREILRRLPSEFFKSLFDL